jgi:catechol 2,3-dioxygenase-like lactoylglutathione lyase family enzyme
MAERVVPMIHVVDVRATASWYESIGFDLVESYGNGGDGLSFAIMAFGATQVMFNAGGRASTQRRRDVDLYVYTQHVDELHQRLKDGVTVIDGPHDTFYGMREVIIRDPNGFWITFAEFTAGAMLMAGVHDGDAALVGAALACGGLTRERLSAALVAATASGVGEIADMLRAAGAVAPPSLSTEMLDRHVGRYEGDEHTRVEITRDQVALQARVGAEPAMPLLPIDDTTFRPSAYDDAVVKFEMENGKTTGLVFTMGHNAMRLTRVA